MHSVPMYGTALRRAGKKSAWCQTMPYMCRQMSAQYEIAPYADKMSAQCKIA
ncbi:MAG: hypothetical protein SLRJCFUN_000746, partial [Candidatus Fervidibacter sp.]